VDVAAADPAVARTQRFEPVIVHAGLLASSIMKAILRLE